MGPASQSAGAKRAGPRFPSDDGFGSFPELGLYLVVDAMGGMLDDPSVVADLVLSVVREAYANGRRGRAGLVESLEAANAAVLTKSHTGRWRGAGATVATLALVGDEAHIAHAGDCRVYRFRHEELEQLTVDHSLRNEMRRQRPKLTAEDIEQIPANVVTRAIGISQDPVFEAQTFAAAPRDLYLLCSNGLVTFGGPEAIAQVLGASATLDAAVACLIDGALARGGKDSVTALLVRI
jgi:serine/threonine protein phosphatase PrpC